MLATTKIVYSTFILNHILLFAFIIVFPAVSDKPHESQSIRDVNHYYAFITDPVFCLECEWKASF